MGIITDQGLQGLWHQNVDSTQAHTSLSPINIPQSLLGYWLVIELLLGA